MSDGVRLLLTPRWIVLSVVGLLAIVAFGMLSHWQWDRAQRDQVSAAQAADPPPVPRALLLPDGSPLPAAVYGRQVSESGRYDGSAQRVLAADGSFWVVTPLVTAGGVVVPVVRGVVAPGAAPVPPEGAVTVTGRLQPYDGDPGVQPGDASLPAGVLPRLTASAVSAAVGRPVVGGWLVLADQQPASDLPALTPPLSPHESGGLRLQNATYAVQWVLFAGFAVFLWVRWFRDELSIRRAGAPEDATLAAT